MQEGNETVLIAKTTADKVDALNDKGLELHSYDCPCVVSIPIVGGSSTFLGWIENEIL